VNLRMRIPLTIACLTFLDIVLSLPQRGFDDSRHLQQNRGFGSTVSSFRPTTASYDDDDDRDNSPSPSQAISARTPAYDEENYPLRNAIGVVQQRPQPRPQQPQQFNRRPSPPQQFRQQLEEEVKEGALEEKEEEEPDRLTVLLPQSKFECVGKNTGYYADEGLGCEVFHYCQNNARHSWVCPEGFTFHQVHLICMPPGNDNICEQSSKYHFVNEYLYKPLNLEEHQNTPNISLRYSDRFYPDQFYQHGYDEEEEDERPRHQPQQQPIRVALQQAPAPHQQRVVSAQRRPVPTQFSPTFRPETTLGQVFRSPEEVNISLQQRRPAYVTQRYLTTNGEEY